MDTAAVQLSAHSARATAGVQDAAGRKAGDEIGLPMDVLASSSSQLVGALIPFPPTQARFHPVILADQELGHTVAVTTIRSVLLDL